MAEPMTKEDRIEAAAKALLGERWGGAAEAEKGWARYRATEVITVMDAAAPRADSSDGMSATDVLVTKVVRVDSRPEVADWIERGKSLGIY